MSKPKRGRVETWVRFADFQEALKLAQRQRCSHEDRSRGGAIWEICNLCGVRWADDRGGYEGRDRTIEKALKRLEGVLPVELSPGSVVVSREEARVLKEWRGAWRSLAKKGPTPEVRLFAATCLAPLRAPKGRKTR